MLSFIHVVMFRSHTAKQSVKFLVVYTSKVSALSYVQGALNNTQSTVEMKRAVTSLYKYYDATKTNRDNRPSQLLTTEVASLSIPLPIFIGCEVQTLTLPHRSDIIGRLTFARFDLS